MNHRMFASVAVLAAVSAVFPFASLFGQAPSSKAATGAAANWTPPRTPWGDPDLQGIWSYATTTPLERPAEFAGKEFLTEEEAAARDAEAEAGADAPPKAGDPGTYNAVWFDRGRTASNRRTSLIIDPADGRLPPFTPDAKRKRDARAAYLKEHPADSWLDRPLADRCIMYHGVPPLPTGYNNTYQIFQIPGYVAILDENIHDVRMIPLDGRPHIGEDIRYWNGDSRGRWEGNTLVVETRNYRPDTKLRFPSSEHTHAVERYTRAGPDLVELRFTIDDPTVYTRPWTALLPMTRMEGKIYEYACHEGNRSMEGILGGARAKENAAK